LALNSLLPAAIPEPRGNPAAHQEAAAAALFTARDLSRQSFLLAQQPLAVSPGPASAFHQTPGKQQVGSSVKI